MNSEEDGFSESENLLPKIFPRRSQHLEEKNKKRAYEHTLFDQDDDDDE